MNNPIFKIFNTIINLEDVVVIELVNREYDEGSFKGINILFKGCNNPFALKQIVDDRNQLTEEYLNSRAIEAFSMLEKCWVEFKHRSVNEIPNPVVSVDPINKPIRRKP